ncbi:hypothetical protein [Halobacteriovorax sp. HLS]|uniref:hypothetical protein n=1 Tax=Halobacteriovorax sp. HLS TaxID=2234000 RepID=UPI000FDB2E32|nr:hypothetical protein [Halobacteriovorax sp. HLS]
MEDMKRVNVHIPISYYESINEKGLKLSGVIREALEDQLNPNTITLSVSPKTHELYMDLFSTTDCEDKDFEPYLKEALTKFVGDLIKKRSDKLLTIKKELEK